MSTLHLPDELVDRLAAEASRRGVTVDELAAETLADRFPARANPDDRDALEAFIGSGDSGDPTWASRDSAELRRDAATRRAG